MDFLICYDDSRVVQNSFKLSNVLKAQCVGFSAAECSGSALQIN